MLDGRDHARLINFARLLVGDTDAEDVVQEFYLKALSGKVNGFRHEADRASWMLQVLRYTALRWLEREQSRKQREFAWARAQYPSVRPTKTAGIPAYEGVIDLRIHLERLVPEDRAILRCICFFDIDDHTVAANLRLSPGQLRGRLYRARRRLKEQLCTSPSSTAKPMNRSATRTVLEPNSLACTA